MTQHLGITETGGDTDDICVVNACSILHIGVSINGGYPKSMVYEGKNEWMRTGGTTRFRTPPYVEQSYQHSATNGVERIRLRHGEMSSIALLSIC